MGIGWANKKRRDRKLKKEIKKGTNQKKVKAEDKPKFVL